MIRFLSWRRVVALCFTLLLPAFAAQAQAPAGDAKARKGEPGGRGFLWEARWPTLIETLAMGLLVAGVASCALAHGPETSR